MLENWGENSHKLDYTREMKELMNKKVYMLLFGGLPAKPSGLAGSVIRRANALVKDGTSNEILVYKYYNNFDNELSLLRKSGKLDDKVNVRYMFNDFAFELGEDNREKIIHSFEDDSYVAIPDSGNKNVFRCYENGVYNKFIWFNNSEKGELNFIDYLTPGFVREKREWYDPKGYVKSIDYMDPKTNKPVRIIRLNRKGQCYLSYSLSPTTGKVNQILWFDQNGKFKEEFKNEDEMLLYWLENFILTNEKEYSLLISEYEFKRKWLSQIKKEQLSIIYTFHSTHFKAPNTFGSPIRNEHVEFLNNLHEIESVVFLTEEQKEDIIAQFGNSDKIHVIPHHAEKVIIKDTIRDSKTVVFLGRFESIKNPTHAVKAFKRVVESIPDAKLHLYGRGNEEQAIKTAIKENSLENNVFIEGFTSNSYEVFAKSAVSVMTSAHEGFHLSLLESMVAGCPSICYDYKYGPKDIVKNGLNGIIIPYGDTHALADSIIDLLTDDEKRQSMSSEAKKVTEKFSEERLIREWNALFEELMSKKKK